MNPYQPFPQKGFPPCLARRELAAEILDNLRRNNVSVVGRVLYGKTSLFGEITRLAEQGEEFHDVVYWDLRHFTPEDDAEFYRRFSEELAKSLTGESGEEARAHFSDPENCTWEGIRDVFDHLEANERVALILMDGLDGPLSSPGLSKNVWDNLCAFAERPCLNLLTASRKRLRELCANPDSRTSDFFRRFMDPPTVLGAFSEDEIGESLGELLEGHEPQPGVVSEFLRQTGGIPVLCTALAGVLFEGGQRAPGQKDVQVAAQRLTKDGSEVLPAAWDAVSEDERMAFAELVQEGELAPTSRRFGDLLVSLGLAVRRKGQLGHSCQLLSDYSESEHKSLRSVSSLFESPDAFARNVPGVVSCLRSQLEIKDGDLTDFLNSMVDNLRKPKLCLKDVRSVYEHALHLVWRVEAPDGNLPPFTSSQGEKLLVETDGVLPPDSARMLGALRLLVDSRNGVTPKKATSQIYCCLNALKGFGDFGQHQQGCEVDRGVAIAACFTALQLGKELQAAGI